MSKKVGITGASGRIGSTLVKELSKLGYDVTPFEYDFETKKGLDLSIDIPNLVNHFKGLDAVIHLAACASALTEWDDLKIHNIETVYNVLEASRLAGVKRIVFASSNHTQHGWSVADFSKPESLREDHPLIKLSDTIIPSSIYGVSKAFGEALGAHYAARYGIEFIALRIGWFAAEHLEAEAERNAFLKSLIGTPAESYMKAIFLAREDLVQIVHKSLTHDFNPIEPTKTGKKPPVIIAYATSNNNNPLFDLTETSQALDYHPTDSSDRRYATIAQESLTD